MTIVTQEFKNLADSVSAFYGYADLPMVIVPHPFVTLSLDEVRAVAEATAQEIFGKLALQIAPDLTTKAVAEVAS